MNKVVVSIGMMLLMPYSAWTPARADHCEEERFSAGPAEAQLGGVKVFDTLPLAEKVLGKSNRHQDFTGPGFPEGSGEAEHTWDIEGVVLTLGTMFRTQSGERIETIYSIEIAGGPPKSRREKRLMKTGRGVGLGASKDDVSNAYGSRFLEEVLNGKKSSSYCWQNDNWLTFTFDASGHVGGIQLLGSVE